MTDPQKPEESSTQRSFIRELLTEAFDIQHGLWQTFFTLLVHPPKVVQAYTDNSRKDYYPPIKWVLLTTALLIFLFYAAIDFDTILDEKIQFSLNEQQAQLDEKDHQQVKIIAGYSAMVYKKMNNEYSAITTLFLLLPSVSLFSFLLYRKRIHSYSDHMIFNAYFIGQINLLQIVLVVPMFFMSTEFVKATKYIFLFDITGVVYLLYAYLRLFASRHVGSWFVATLPTLLGAGLFILLTTVIALGTAVIMMLMT